MIKSAQLLTRPSTARPASSTPSFASSRPWGPLHEAAAAPAALPAASTPARQPIQMLPGVGVPALVRQPRSAPLFMATAVIQRAKGDSGSKTKSESKEKTERRRKSGSREKSERGGRSESKETSERRGRSESRGKSGSKGRSTSTKSSERARKGKGEEETVEMPPLPEAPLSTSTAPMTLPTDPVEKRDADPILQPVRVMMPAKEEKFEPLDSETVEKLIEDDKARQRSGGGGRGGTPDPSPLRKHKKVALKELAGVKGVHLKGALQGGLYPSEKSQTAQLPEVVDYARARPMQMLSQLSEVMLHAAKKAGQEPVEVQFGYGVKAGNKKKGSSFRLMASTNNRDSQKWLAKALKNPREHIHDALRSDDPHLQRVALKLLKHGQQQYKRREAVKKLPAGDERRRLKSELALTDAIHQNFVGSETRTIESTAPKKQERHAEQNIGRHLVQHKFDWGEIAGTMIRCEACSSELGANITDEKGRMLIGKAYAAQAGADRHEDTMEDVARGHTRVVIPHSARARSSSPPPAVERASPRKGKKRGLDADSDAETTVPKRQKREKSTTPRGGAVERDTPRRGAKRRLDDVSDVEVPVAKKPKPPESTTPRKPPTPRTTTSTRSRGRPAPRKYRRAVRKAKPEADDG